jgi:hypothetical protein
MYKAAPGGATLGVSKEGSGGLGLTGMEVFEVRSNLGFCPDCAAANAAKGKDMQRIMARERGPWRRKFFSVEGLSRDANRGQIRLPVTSGQRQPVPHRFLAKAPTKLPGCANYFLSARFPCET